MVFMVSDEGGKAKRRGHVYPDALIDGKPSLLRSRAPVTPVAVGPTSAWTGFLTVELQQVDKTQNSQK